MHRLQYKCDSPVMLLAFLFGSVPSSASEMQQRGQLGTVVNKVKL